MLTIDTLYARYTFCGWNEAAEGAALFPRPERVVVLQWLRGWRTQGAALQVVHEAVLRYGVSPGPFRLDDPDAVEQLAQLVVSGRVRVLVDYSHRASGGGGGGPAPTPPPSPPVPTPPAPRPPAPTPPPPPSPNEQKGNLLVEVYDDQGKLITEQVEITATGPESLKQVTTSGTHTFSGITPGTYSVTAKVPPDRFDANARTVSSVPPVPAGGTGKARLEFKWLVNVVTPRIEVEYKVVLLDRGLSAHQGSAETKLVTDNVTYIQVSARQSTGKPPYKGEGGTFEASPGKVDVFTDAGCTTPLAGKIKAAELFAGPVKLYLRAKTAGKFTAELTLDPSGDGRVSVDPPATEEMGVVELKAVVHRYDKGALDALEIARGDDAPAAFHTRLKDLALPAQKAMSDEQKVKDGRFLHVQSAGSHARARLLVKKLDAGQWPAGTDDYDIVLAGTNGLGLYDAAVEGSAKSLPQKFKVKDLKALDQEFWVEGSAESAALRDGLLMLGLDRPAGGLAHLPKNNGDFSRFTVVKVQSVELVATVTSGQPKVWDAAQGRYYINTEAGEAGRTLGPKSGARDVKVRVSLGKPIPGVPVHVMLAPDAANAAPAGLPADWKQEKLKDALRVKDRKDRKSLLHFGAVTAADGKAEVTTLVLSGFGGDRFTPAAYIEQDPHLAKYVTGHDVLGKRLPVLAAKPIEVWKYFQYKIVFMKRHDGADYSNRLSETDLKDKYKSEFIELERKGSVVVADYQDMVPYDTARAWVTGKLGAEEARVLQFALVNAIGKTATTDVDVALAGVPSLSFNVGVNGGRCFDLSARANWLKSATCNRTGQPPVAIPGDKITLVNDGVRHKLSVDLSAQANLTGVPLANVEVKVVLIEHDYPSGLSWGAPTLIGMRWREAGYPGKEAEATMRTTYHESGHYLGLAPKTLPDTAAGASSVWYNSPGVGDHCKHGPQDCTMWHSFILKINFCPTCKLALRARDHATQVGGDTPF